MLPDFLEEDKPQGVLSLKSSLKIPIGVKEETTHYLVLQSGTYVTDIPHKVSQKREELGLSPQIQLGQQDSLLQKWQIAKDITFTAPMPGKIYKLCVKQGDHVERAQTLYVLECMKMEHAIGAPYAGHIQNCFVKAGQIVSHQAILFTLIPDNPVWEDSDPTPILPHKNLLLSFFPWEVSAVEEQEDAAPAVGSENEVTLEQSDEGPKLLLDIPQESTFLLQRDFDLPEVPTIFIRHKDLYHSVSSPRRRGSIPTIWNKITILWTPAFAGMTPLRVEQSNFTFNEYMQNLFQPSLVENGRKHSPLASKNFRTIHLPKILPVKIASIRAAYSPRIEQEKTIVCLPPSPKVLVKMRPSTILETISNDSFTSLAKWLFGLFVLIALVVSMRKSNVYKKESLIIICSKVNDYDVLTNKKLANNYNNTLYVQTNQRKLQLLMSTNRSIPIRKRSYIT
jgi:biotin carboxyl carrier protein